MHRRLYNGIASNWDYDKNPFITKGNDSYYALLDRKGIIPKNQSIGKLDDVSHMNVGFEKKLRYLYKGMRIFYKLIGYKNYVLFLQFIRRLSLYDNNTYLLGKEYENYELK